MPAMYEAGTLSRHLAAGVCVYTHMYEELDAYVFELIPLYVLLVVLWHLFSYGVYNGISGERSIWKH